MNWKLYVAIFALIVSVSCVNIHGENDFDSDSNGKNYSAINAVKETQSPVKGCNMEEGFYFKNENGKMTWYQIIDMHQDRSAKSIRPYGVLWGTETEGFGDFDPWLVLAESKDSSGKSEQLWALMGRDNPDCVYQDQPNKPKRLKLYMIFYEDGRDYFQWVVDRV